MSQFPDVSSSIPTATAIPADQARAAGVEVTRRALAEDWPQEHLVEVLQMLGIIDTVPGARTNDLGDRIPPRRSRARRT